MITKTEWTTSREDLDSFTTNPETGNKEHVVYIYRGDQPRIAVFAGKENNARDDARAIASAMNTYETIGEMAEKLDNLAAASRLPMEPKDHVYYLARGILSASKTLKTIFTKITGENPWALT